MRCLSRIIVYTLLLSSAAQAGPLSRSERLRRTYLGIEPTEDNITPVIQARQEVDDGTTPTPIFSTIVPDAPNSTTPPPQASSASDDNGDAYGEDEGPLTTTPESSSESSGAPEQVTPPVTTSSDAETTTDAPVPSSEQAFLPPISSKILVPPSLRPSQTADEPSTSTEASSAALVVTSFTTGVIRSQTSEPPSASTDAFDAPGGEGDGSGGNDTPTPVFSTISVGSTAASTATSSEEQLSFASTLQLPIGEKSTSVLEPGAPSSNSTPPTSTVADELASSSAPTEQLSSVSQPGESVSSSVSASETIESSIASTIRSISDQPLFTTTVGIPSDGSSSSAVSSAFSSVPGEQSQPAASSALPAETSTLAITTTVAEITPTGEPDNQVPTNRGPPNPSATSSIPPEQFQANLEQALAFHESFKSLTEQSACFGEQAACINGGIARCQPEQGRFAIQACNDPNEECFPIPLVFEDGVKLACTDPAEARRILGIEEEGNPSEPSTTSSADQVVTVTETPTVTEIIATETVDNGAPPQSSSSAPPAEGVVTVTATPTITEIIATETVENPGAEVSSAPPSEPIESASDPGEATTTIIRGPTLTLTTFITVQPPPPEPTEPVTTQFITVIITALPSNPPETPSEVVEVPEPTSSVPPANGGDGGLDDDRGDDGRGDGDDDNNNNNNGDDGDDDERDEDGDPILTSLDVIIIPTTLLTTTIRATPLDVEQAAATPVDDIAPTVTKTITEIVSVPVLVTVTQKEVRIEQATVTATVVHAA